MITAVLALWLTPFERQLFNPQLYKDALAQQHVYYQLPVILGEILTSNRPLNPCAGSPVTCENIPPKLKTCYQKTLGNARYATLASGQDQASAAEQILIQACLNLYGTPSQTPTQANSQNQNGTPAFMETLTAANWATVINLLLPPQDLQSMLEGGLDQTFAYLNGETDTASLSLVKLREHLAGPAGSEILLILIHSQPACTTEVLEKIIVGLTNGKILLCNPLDDQTLSLILPILQEPLTSLVNKIPDEATLIEPPPAGSPEPGSGSFGSDPITTLRIVRRVISLSPIMPLAFLLLITSFGVRSFKSWLQWCGIPILITGLITLGLAGVTMLTLNWGWNTFIVTRIPSYLPTAIADIGRAVAIFIVGTVVRSVVLQAVILAFVGLLAWAGSFFVKSRPA